MATHSSVLAWRIPGTAGPGGLPSMGSHRVGHDWSDLTAAYFYHTFYNFIHIYTFILYLIFLGPQITADGDCSHEIKRCLLLGRTAMTHWNMYIIIYETDRQFRFDAWDRVLSAGTLGWLWGMGGRGRWEGGFRMGNTCTPMADSCQCMTKTTTIL